MTIQRMQWFPRIILQASLVIFPMHVKASPEILKPCPDSPNCVSSQIENDRHSIEPIRFTEPANEVWQRLISILQSSKRTKIVEQSETYLHVEVSSLLFRFVDDVEFLLRPEEKLIHIRSASRTGYSDFGVNRRRVDRLREALIARD